MHRKEPYKRKNTIRPRPGKSDESIRLNRYIASTGLCSRREADQLISAGLISVNGKVISQLGTKVTATDMVKYNGQRIKDEKQVYILMNKPADFITTTEDPYAKKTVLDIIGNSCPARIYPVGRLDRNTTGVLLLTNDGELTKKLTHPSFNKKKIYHVFLNKQLTRGDLKKITDGLELDDGFIRPDAIQYVRDDDKTQVGIELHSGRNRIVRRIFESLGYRIKKLDRVYFAGLTKKGLRRGQWRYLTQLEINMLKKGSYE